MLDESIPFICAFRGACCLHARLARRTQEGVCTCMPAPFPACAQDIFHHPWFKHGLQPGALEFNSVIVKVGDHAWAGWAYARPSQPCADSKLNCLLVGALHTLACPCQREKRPRALAARVPAACLPAGQPGTPAARGPA